MWTLIFLFVALLIAALLYCQKSNRYDLKRKNVIITGGTSGIGLKIVEQLIREGEVNAVIIWGRSEENVVECRGYLKTYCSSIDSHCNIDVMKVDVRNTLSIKEAADAILQKFESIDVVINNAGTLAAKSSLSGELTAEVFEETIKVNTTSHCAVVNAFLPHMITKKSGYFVSILSTMSFCYASRLADYCASKWAALAYLHCLRFELKAAGLHNIRILGVCPFLTQTALFDGAFEGDGDTTVRKLLFPTLSAADVAAAVVDGVKYRREMIVLPPSMAYLCGFTAMLPICIQDWIIQLFGGAIGMKNFRGKNHKK